MVAISLYKGNLHKVPDVPRKWLMPTRQITIKDFKALLRRRSRALSRLSSPNPKPDPNTNPNPSPAATDLINNNLINNNDTNREIENAIDNGTTDAGYAIPPLEDNKGKNDKEEENLGDGAGGGVGSEGGDCLVKMEVEVSDSAAVDAKRKADLPTENEFNVVEEGIKEEKKEEKKEEERAEEDVANPNSQTINKEAAESNEAIRKKEVEERLKVLKEKKHNLVQVLKQIQNAEEELKRRGSGQGVMVRPSVALQVDIPIAPQVDIPNDTGSVTRLNTPRMGSDGNTGPEVEGGEPDGSSNLNTDSRHLLRMSSTSPSPSSDSQHKKPAYNVVPHPARTTLGVSASPSRFAPTGQQGQTPNPPAVSVSGTNYVASSPSPAASGGTSVLRENRIPSPWN